MRNSSKLVFLMALLIGCGTGEIAITEPTEEMKDGGDGDSCAKDASTQEGCQIDASIECTIEDCLKQKGYHQACAVVQCVNSQCSDVRFRPDDQLCDLGDGYFGKCKSGVCLP